MYVRVGAIEIPLHLIEKALLMLGQWHGLLLSSIVVRGCPV
jgi:hypothetical protein